MNRDAAIMALEMSLLDVSTRSDRHALEALLAPDFYEIGSSGRTYDREAVIHALIAEPYLPEPVEIIQAHIRWLADSVALLTYDARRAHSGIVIHRSSIWVADGASWRLAFHQGTPAR